ncbi:hypothetical protein GCM10023188_06810 [Pontibacter saemangeumensis]|uniref:NlpE N-terminal domain-containing protein n=1 Tax=Pontibacter saemangeumensis TaxID=1084525 RepID=A0ABP8L9X5_9BACT
MKTILTLCILFSMTFGLQQVQAQSAMSYDEWRASAGGGKKAAKKPAKATKAKSSTKEGKAEAAAPKTAMAAPAGTFRGTIPCTDCKGIDTELVLNGDANGSSRTFTMRQTYLGKPADKNVVVSSGKWFLAKGNNQDPDAMTLQLIPTEGINDMLYFVQVSDTEIKLLDKKQTAIQRNHNYSLKKR